MSHTQNSHFQVHIKFPDFPRYSEHLSVTFSTFSKSPPTFILRLSHYSR